MSLYETLESRRSIRKYKSRDVSDKLLNKILSAATQASSSGNMQAYSVIVTKDQNVKNELYPLHFEQDMVLEAPVFLTFCADFHRKRRWLEMNQANENFDNFMSFMIASIDAILYSQNVALLAEEEGLGICYLGTTLASCNKISKVLNCPENVVPVVGFSLGFPDEKPDKRNRLPLKGIVHRDKYQDYSRDEIEAIYSEKAVSGWERYLSNAELRKKVKEMGLDNLAQVYTHLKYTKESHQTYSEDVLSCIKEQNFMN